MSVQQHGVDYYLKSPVIVLYGTILGAMFTLAGPVCGIFIVQMFLEARDSASWPTTPGVLIQAEVTSAGAGHYKASVAYTYTVNGDKLQGNSLRASGGEYDSYDAAANLLGSYRPGQAVVVHYDPTNSSHSLLQAGAGFPEYALLTIPFITSGIGIAGLWFVIWGRHRFLRTIPTRPGPPPPPRW